MFGKRMHIMELKDLHKQNPHEFKHSGDFSWHQSSTTRLGKGAFGEVFLGYSDQETFQVAVKVVKEDFYTKERKVYTNLKREIKIMEELISCEFVVRLMQVEEQKGLGMVLVMEICDCDLEEYLKKNEITEKQFRRFLKQLSVGVRAMHTLSIVHRDLKPQNILLKFPGADSRARGQEQTAEWDIRLADFGYSRFYKENTGDFANRNIDMESLAGTPVFMAPEALYCVMYPGGSYDHTVDIWSVGALLYRVLVGKCGFFAPIQDILRILKAKGDAIAFTRHSRKTSYVRELPPEVDDILTPVFKERMTWLIKSCLAVEAANRITYDVFYQAVDDLVQTKIRLVSIHSGLESKVPYGDDPLLISHLRKMINTDFKIQSDNLVILRDTAQTESTISNQSDLDNFVNFSKSQRFGGSGRDPILFLLDQSVLSQMDPPALPLLAYEELIEFLKSPERIEEVRTRDNVEFVPQIFSKLVKDIELTADSQVSGLIAYVQYALGARDRHKSLRVKLNEDLSPLRMRIRFLTNQLSSYAESLSLSYREECVSFREMGAELESIRCQLEDSVAEIDADVLRRHGALLSDTERAPPLSVRDVIRPLLGECRALKRLQVAEQLIRAKLIRINIENRHQDLNVQIHYRLNSNGQVLSQFHTSQLALLALKKEMKEIQSFKVDTISDKFQRILLAIIHTPKLTNENPGIQGDNSDQSRRLQLKFSELEGERNQLIESSSKLKMENDQLIGQLEKERESQPIVQSVLDSANSKIAECSSWLDWLKGALGVLEPPIENQLTEEFQTADWEPTLGASCRELSKSVQRYPSSVLKQMKAEVGRKLTNEEVRDPMSARFSVADFRKGSFILFLPTKPMGPYKSVPKAFCIDNKQYFLHKDCYEDFKLKQDQSLATWLLGQATEEPIKDTARHVCQYPAGRTGTEFFTIRANYHFAPANKAN